ncbi:unnamed protein product [Symbiodinium microadriaticum]|nr:unnamed protein product [Symbiodinium microadriaticum]CAE7943993.1 unnamed protein product [Symbiodinium sp. KB8]
MPACLCAAEPLLDTPSSLPAVQLQLRMVESTIANAEHDLEASWLNTCFPQPAPGFYVDEEWGFAGAPQLRRCSEALGDFRDARQKLLRRLEELQSPKQAEEAMANAAEDRLKERVRRLEFKLADAESWNDKMSEAMQKLLQTQAGLEQSVESLETQCAALRHQTSAAESCKDQIEGWLESQRMAQESTIEQLRAENVKLQRENATLAEQAQLQRQRADRLHQENDQLRGQGGYPEMLPDGLAADCDACSDASWVCVLSSDRNIFAAGTMLKAKVGQAFEYLQAKDLQKGAQILASDDQSLLEVLDTPEAQRSVELIELWTEDRSNAAACFPVRGTQSMHVAMNILGLNTLHSGYSFLKRAPWCEYVFANGSLEDAMATLEGYDAAMDEPFQLVYEEIMRAFPKTKFVLTISDPERWYESYTELIAGMAESAATRNRTHSRNLRSGFRAWLDSDLMTRCTAARYWGCDFGNETGEDTKKQCLEAYQQHNERVQQVIPADRLLVYNFTDGWAPLAHFLGKPIPDVEFPHVDLPGLIFEHHEPEPSEPVSMLSVARQQLLLFVPASGDPLQEEAASLAQACLAETLHPGDWIKVNGRFSRLTRVEVRALEEVEHVQFDLSPSLPAATFSLALREKDPFVAAV